MNNFNYFEAMFFNGVDDLKYIKNCVTDHQEILGEIRRILVERNCISEEPFNSRVFINNGTRDDFGALVSNFPPEQNEHLDDWLKRITCEDSFCVVLNGINAWSDDISKKIHSEFTLPWISRYGIPSQGVDVYAFMGKYKLTPFGIHKDKEHTFLFHLGPGIKLAWVWDPRLIDLSPLIKKTSFNLTDVLMYSKEITLKPGDGLLIPQNWYHVLENPSFSVTLGIAPYNKTKAEVMHELLDMSIQDNLNNKNEEYYLNNKINHPNQIQKNEFINIRLNTLSNEGIERLLCQLISKQFFKYPPALRLIKEKKYHLFCDVVIEKKAGSKTRLHCRGRCVLIDSKLTEKVSSFLKLIGENGFYYRNKKSEKNNLLNSLLEKLIELGVLI